MVFTLTILLFLFGTSVYAQPTFFHVVQPGDTLTHVASKHGVTVGELVVFNEIDEPNKIWVGDVILIPPKGYIGSEIIEGVTPGERLLLARVIYAEARGESFEGKVAVGAVIVNRVKSSSFPSTIREVVYQPGQFTPVENDILPEFPDYSSWDAALRALAGEDPSGGALFFYNPRITRYRDFWKTRTVIKVIGNHNFAI